MEMFGFKAFGRFHRSPSSGVIDLSVCRASMLSCGTLKWCASQQSVAVRIALDRNVVKLITEMDVLERER
jgi:hypothetical protein